ncbi:MAG: hypothetical protein M3126_09415 [Candidatus Eremiobacteraeota bacterium]|nr:hypothetical protein [Candidatus Eremiobacteraeota bacterium]
MSAVDPLAALAARLAVTQGGADVALDLGAVAQILAAQLNLGDVLSATVLAPQGGQDLIEILGQTVVAQLPPDVHPGETLLLQVTGFSGNQIIVRNLGAQDPFNPVPVFIPELPAALPGNPVTTAVVLTTISNPNPGVAQPPPVIIPPAANGAPVAPPTAVFVAASIKQQTPSPAAGVQTAVPPEAAQAITAPSAANVESRLAATRAATAERVLQTPQQQARIAAAPPRPVPAAAVAPQITARTAVPLEVSPIARQTPAVPAAPAVYAPPLASKDAVSILAALRAPATPVTLAAARLVSTAGEQVQAALQNLQSVLAQGAPADARVATLQTLSSFLGRFDARNPQTLAAQISSFVSNVLEGAEHKLSALLQALVPRDAASAASAAGANLPTHVSSPAPAHAGIIAQAHAVERQAAITQDLKSTLLSLAANPPGGASPQLSQAITQTLTALTAMQFNSLAGAQQDPNSIALSIPMIFFDGGQSANVRIFRDAPKSKGRRMDADNFHIAFVLETQALGTVGIDLETVGRAVKVAVKTDRASAVDPFNTSLSELRARLEHLRYNVTSTQAEMLSAPVVAAPAKPVSVAAQKTTNVDLRA